MSDKLIMSNKFILLIDGDNFSPNCVKFMIDDIKSRGDIIIKKVYGDFSSKAMNWKNSCYEYQIEALQVWSRNRKQATDNRLLTDGVEMICNYPNFTHIAIASGDIDMSDLVRIAKYHNKYVIGYSSGKKHTSNLLKKCCDEFIICRKPMKNSVNSLINASNASNSNHSSNSSENQEIVSSKEIKQQIRKILEESEEKLRCSQLKEKLLRIDNTFTQTNYGKSTFTKLLRDFGFNIELIETTYWIIP